MNMCHVLQLNLQNAADDDATQHHLFAVWHNIGTRLIHGAIYVMLEMVMLYLA